MMLPGDAGGTGGLQGLGDHAGGPFTGVGFPGA